MWEEMADRHAKAVGFRALGAEWPSVYFHDELCLMLVFYVDDFKLAGPRSNTTRGWELLRRGLGIETPKEIDASGSVYLGCRQERSEIMLPSGQMATAMTYNMEEFLDSCISLYKDLAGPKTVVKSYATPFFQEDHRTSPAGAPGVGPVQECPWCSHTFPPAPTWDSIDKLLESKNIKDPGAMGGQPSAHHEDRGRLQPVAARILMKVLWAA